MYIFFFSSRRRHTRCSRDWSSDVCSSDLMLHHSRADGTLFPVEECRVHRVTQTGEGVHAEDEVFWRANGTSFPAEHWSYPRRRGQEVVGAVVAFINITEIGRASCRERV